jgi:hypothetical protein
LFTDVLRLQLFKINPPEPTMTTQDVPPLPPYNAVELMVKVPLPVIFMQFMLFVRELPIDALVSVAVPEAE